MLLTAGDTFTYTISADEPGSLFITQPRYLRTHASASPYDALKNLYLIFRPGTRPHRPHLPQTISPGAARAITAQLQRNARG